MKQISSVVPDSDFVHTYRKFEQSGELGQVSVGYISGKNADFLNYLPFSVENLPVVITYGNTGSRFIDSGKQIYQLSIIVIVIYS